MRSAAHGMVLLQMRAGGLLAGRSERGRNPAVGYVVCVSV